MKRAEVEVAVAVGGRQLAWFQGFEGQTDGTEEPLQIFQIAEIAIDVIASKTPVRRAIVAPSLTLQVRLANAHKSHLSATR
jgi:hypothetical protein